MRYFNAHLTVSMCVLVALSLSRRLGPPPPNTINDDRESRTRQRLRLDLKAPFSVLVKYVTILSSYVIFKDT